MLVRIHIADSDFLSLGVRHSYCIIDMDFLGIVRKLQVDVDVCIQLLSFDFSLAYIFAKGN